LMNNNKCCQHLQYITAEFEKIIWPFCKYFMVRYRIWWKFGLFSKPKILRAKGVILLLVQKYFQRRQENENEVFPIREHL
jgi:hypothetical protein